MLRDPKQLKRKKINILDCTFPEVRRPPGFTDRSETGRQGGSEVTELARDVPDKAPRGSDFFRCHPRNCVYLTHFSFQHFRNKCF